MEETHFKYDYLITRLLPIHKTLLLIEDNEADLIVCINELKIYISIYDHNKAGQLDSLLHRLVLSEKNSLAKDVKRQSFINIRNEALQIFTKFFFELDPEEKKYPHLSYLS